MKSYILPKQDYSDGRFNVHFISKIYCALCFHRHGYGRWQAIVDDKELKVQELICQELNLPYINLPVPGQQASTSAQNGATVAGAETAGSQAQGNGNESAPEVTQGSTTDATYQTQTYQDSSILYHFRDMQRRQVEFIKKRVLLLEKGLNIEYQQLVYVSKHF